MLETVIASIQEAEAKAAARINEANAEAQEIIKRAEAEAATLRADGANRAKQEAEAIRAQLTAAAEAEVSAIQATFAQEQATLEEQALTRLGEAKALILGRIVNQDGHR